MIYEFLSPMLQWLNAHPNIAGLATFFISAIESIAIIGTIIPGSVMMTAIGTLAGAGVIPFWSTIIWAILGAILGDGISYWLGHYYKDRIHSIWPFRQYPYVLEKGEDFFRRHGGKSVFIGRFVGPVRALVPLIAGMLGMSPWRFTIANVTSAIGWAPAYMLPGLLLGAASLQLPPDVAVHVILVFLLIGLFIIFCLWIIQRILSLISHQINHLLTNLWKYLSKSRKFNFITRLLKHYNPKKTYGQLILAIYLLLVCAIFTYLSFYIFFNTSPSIEINSVVFHLFRSLRTSIGDDIMIYVAFLGDKTILMPIIFTLFVWLVYTKRLHTAWHVLLLGIITASSIVILKYLIHSPRPWGIQHSSGSFSFPSAHTTLVVTFFMGFALFLIEIFKIKRPKLIIAFAMIIIFIVSISRVYLGAHWFTDIVGGWLLGAAILMFITISYNRTKEKVLKPTGILVVTILTFAITYSAVAMHCFEVIKQNSIPLAWPNYVLSENNWWSQTGDRFPLFRVNRFGFAGSIFNVQWLDNIDRIKSILLENEWKNPSPTDWISVLHRITDIESTEHLPLVSPLHLDRDPVLVLTKQVDKKTVVLRFWQSDVIFNQPNSPLSLWVGSVEQIPRTYSWLLNRKPNDFSLVSTLLFTKPLKNYDIKRTEVHVERNYSQRVCTIILIKPKS